MEDKILKKDQYAMDKEAWCNLNRPGISASKADVVVFGIPFDKGVSYRSGVADGPGVLQQNTFTSTPYTEQFKNFSSLIVHDAGDFIDGSRDHIVEEVTEFVSRLAKQEIFFTAVGGDHSVTIPIEAGIDKALGGIRLSLSLDICLFNLH